MLNVEDKHSLCPLALSALALAEALALHSYVVAEHGSEDEILFGRQFVERTGDDEPDGIETLSASEEQIQPIVAHGLKDIVDALTLQPTDGELLVFFVECEEHHAAHTFFIFVDVVHEHFHIDGHDVVVLVHRAVIGC